MLKSQVFPLLLGLFFFALQPVAAATLKEIPLPAELTPGIDHLLAQVGPAPQQAFNPSGIEGLLNFVLSAKATGQLYVPEKRGGATAAYYEFDLQGDLQRLLRYTANPEIPAHLFMPSSVRRVRWLATEGGDSAMPQFAELLTNLQSPKLVRGREREEITPNLNTGTYFAYDLDRTLILLQHRGQPVLVSLTRQKKTSDIGKKGVVLGNDASWDYIYSGQQGMTKSGLGWASTYMYDSFSITVYYQVPGRGLVRCSVLKWLDAGWAGVNFVSSRHIYDGLVRFGQDYKGVLEHPRLPSPEALAAQVGRLGRLAPTQVDGLLKTYLAKLEARYGKGGERSDPSYVELVQGETYLQGLKLEEKQAMLGLETLKCLLGKDCIDPLLLAAQ